MWVGRVVVSWAKGTRLFIEYFWLFLNYVQVLPIQKFKGRLLLDQGNIITGVLGNNIPSGLIFISE